MSRLNFQTYDRENKVTSTSLPPLTAVTNLQIQALADAFDAILIGSPVSAVKTVSTVVDAGQAGPATAPFAQAGNKWLIRYDDGDGKTYTAEIGCADNALLAGASDFLDLTAGPGLAFKNAFEDAVSVDGTTEPILLSVQQVNRAR